MTKEKIGAFVLICTNENNKIVSCDGYKTEEAAQGAMMQEFESERNSFASEGYDDLNIKASLGLRSASVEVSDDNKYEWVIKEI